MKSTLTLALHREVIAWIFAPLIPALSASIELRVLSSSATADDMLAVYDVSLWSLSDGLKISRDTIPTDSVDDFDSSSGDS